MAEPGFTLQYRGLPILVQEHAVSGDRVFRVTFSDGTLPLTLTVGTDRTGKRFWTSVPPKRMSEAEVIGPLIGRYFHDKKQQAKSGG